MQTRTTTALLAVLILSSGRAAAQHHHGGFHSGHASMAMGGSYGHWHHHGHGHLYGYPWGGYTPVYGFGAYPIATPSYGSSAAGLLIALNWQQAQAREQELAKADAAREHELAKANAAKQDARRQVHAGRREKCHSDRERRKAERGAQRVVRPEPSPPLAAGPLVRNGAVAWPALLRGGDYQAGREALEQLFAEGPKDGDFGHGSEHALEVERLSTRILAELKSRIRDVGPNDYLVARRFVLNLIEEARRPGLVDQVAGR